MLLLLLACYFTKDEDTGDTAAGGGGAGEEGGAGAEGGGAEGGDGGGEREPLPEDVSVAFTGWVATVSGLPAGLEGVAMGDPVAGSFSYASSAPDSDEDSSGWYAFVGDAHLEMEVGVHRLTSSAQPVIELDGFATFRWIDGEDVPDEGFDEVDSPDIEVDGVPARDLGIWSAFVNEALFPDDTLPSSFPELPFPETPHTFSISDEGGTLLLQLDRMGPA